MAKNEIKSYVISRLKTLKSDHTKEIKKGKSGEDIDERIDEVKNFASNFGIKTKDIEAALQD